MFLTEGAELLHLRLEEPLQTDRDTEHSEVSGFTVKAEKLRIKTRSLLTSRQPNRHVSVDLALIQDFVNPPLNSGVYICTYFYTTLLWMCVKPGARPQEVNLHRPLLWNYTISKYSMVRNYTHNTHRSIQVTMVTETDLSFILNCQKNFRTTWLKWFLFCSRSPHWDVHPVTSCLKVFSFFI